MIYTQCKKREKKNTNRERKKNKPKTTTKLLPSPLSNMHTLLWQLKNPKQNTNHGYSNYSLKYILGSLLILLWFCYEITFSLHYFSVLWINRITTKKSTLWVSVTLSLGKLHIIKIKYVPSLLQLMKNELNSLNKWLERSYKWLWKIFNKMTHCPFTPA